jgi:flagellar biosynthesis protein FlhG
MNHIKSPQVIVIASGKGGTGKSTLSINLSMALADRGKRVAILDANLELPSIATLLNISPTYTITNLVEGSRSLREVICNGPKGINLILGSSLPTPMTNLSPAHHFGIVNAFNVISKELDILIVDTAPGINKSTLNFIRASQEILLVTNSEPTALASTNTLINTLHREYNIQHFRVLINRTHDKHEGQKAFKTIQKSHTNNIDLFLNYAGYTHEHKFARMAANKGQALYEMFPKSEFVQDIQRLAQAIEGWPIRETPTGQIEFFMERLIKKASSIGRPEEKLTLNESITQ